MTERDNYFNLRQKGSQHYSANWNLPGSIGAGFMGKSLDECARDILSMSRKGGVSRVQLKSHLGRHDGGNGYQNISLDDLELLVDCLNENPDGITYELAPTPVSKSFF